MNAITPFQFDNHSVRVVDLKGFPWFIVADICAALGLSNPSQTVAALDPDEKMTLSSNEGHTRVGVEHPSPSRGGARSFVAVSESGLYTIILRCREAMTPGSVPHRFRKWVTGEVLPAIRKTGSYGAPDPMAALSDPATLRGLLADYSEKVLTLQGQVEEMRPQVQALERIADTEGSFCITDAAKTLGINPKALFRWLRQNRWIYTRAGTSQEVAYQERMVAGHLEHKTTTVTRPDGSEKTVTQVRVTSKGLTKLATIFPPTLEGL